MSRYATQGGNAVAANMLTNIASKESNYKSGIKNNHGMAKQTAERIRELEQVLPELISSEIIPASELQELLQSYKDSVKEIAAANVERERNVVGFVAAIKQVQQGLAASSASASSQENDADNLVDYQAAITNAMTSIKQSNASMQIDVKQEKMYREVAEALGETTAAGNNANANDDDDDDIQVVPDAAAHHSVVSCKCPITSAYMEDAVKSKVCGHTYSKKGILSYISNMRHGHGAKCPIAGCGNPNVTQSQLEEDTEMVMRVRREQRRVQRESEQIASQAANLDDDESDEE